MTTITNKENKRIADLHHNYILSPGTSEVIGIILGNLVYGKNGSVKGKYIHNAIYSTEGEKLAVEERKYIADKQIDTATIRQQSWKLIDSIKSHICTWIEPKNKWANASLPEFLMS